MSGAKATIAVDAVMNSSTLIYVLVSSNHSNSLDDHSQLAEIGGSVNRTPSQILEEASVVISKSKVCGSALDAQSMDIDIALGLSRVESMSRRHHCRSAIAVDDRWTLY